MGISKDDRIGLWLADSVGVLDYAASYFALQMLGAIPVLIPWEMRVTDAVAVAKMHGIMGFPEIASAFVPCQCWNYSDIKGRASRTRVSVARPEIVRSDDAQMLFTSGTTGKPKLIRCSHANLVAPFPAPLPPLLQCRTVESMRSPDGCARYTGYAYW